jgi:hypothetical protein
VTDNPTLATCEAEWLRDSVGVDKIGGQVFIWNNDDLGVCGP